MSVAFRGQQVEQIHVPELGRCMRRRQALRPKPTRTTVDGLLVGQLWIRAARNPCRKAKRSFEAKAVAAAASQPGALPPSGNASEPLNTFKVEWQRPGSKEVGRIGVGLHLQELLQDHGVPRGGSPMQSRRTSSTSMDILKNPLDNI